MEYLDRDRQYNTNLIVDGIREIDDKIQEKIDEGVINSNELTRLRYEQLLRGLYLTQLNW